MYSLEQLFSSDSAAALGNLALYFVVYLVAGLLPVCVLLYLVYFLLTLPLRRKERARMFLDLLELGLKNGLTPEAAVFEASMSRDASLGARFHLLAAHIEGGLRFDAALEKVPRLLPPQVRAMLGAGERIGDIAKVLPACRQFLKDGVSQVRSALNYLVLLAFAVTPLMVFIPLTLRFKVMPAYRAVFEGMTEGQPLPAFTRLVLEQNTLLTALQLGIVGFLWLAMLAYLGGPRLHRWVHKAMPGLLDEVAYRLPWRRKRLQRDFSTMLAALLDAEVPETEAVALAAGATANSVFQDRAAVVRQRLQEGVKLPEALRALDDTGELHWRLSNALQRGGGFLRTLSGWHEALDAKAFQLEQGAAQLTTTALVLLNGLIVASIVIAVFLALIQLINEAILW